MLVAYKVAFIWKKDLINSYSLVLLILIYWNSCNKCSTILQLGLV